ncbi:MAG: sigma-54-dependent Fis family transcriptional regulator [Myxococcales bacterium]|nr:sigma-54-dependent Fis family transcriptional regulator [Myxococcales bacterium]
MDRPSRGPRTAPVPRRVLVVDDVDSMRSYLKNLLSLRGYQVDAAESGSAALAAIDQGLQPEVVLLDVMMPGMDGLETLDGMVKRLPKVPVIMLTVVGKAGTVVEAMSRGASDYLNKPFEEEELELAIQRVLEKEQLQGENRTLRQRLRAHEQRENSRFLWASEKMMQIHDLVEQVGDADVTVLICGESGVGKEVVARTLHELSTRCDGPFVKVNCAALPEQLLESELFGYERGAFTGASSRKAGKFEIADGGTIFLDEIGEMSPPLQAKLLQVLQDGEFSRLGGEKDVHVDARVISASNRDLAGMVGKGLFREDLFYRLNVVNILVPPLRERVEEIPVFIDHFVREYSKKYSRELRPLSDSLLARLVEYPFPGNVRELENMVKRVVVLQSEDSVLEEIDAKLREPSLFAGPSAAAPEPPGAESVASAPAEVGDEQRSLKEIGRSAALAAERVALERVLAQTNWNRKKAAQRLAVSYKTLLQKIKETGLGGS